MGDNQTAKFKERETYNQILEFMQRSDVKAVFKKNQVGLRKYFKFYASLGNHEIGVDLEHYMNQMNFKEFVKFGYQTKIVPVLTSGDGVTTTFRHIARQACNALDEGKPRVQLRKAQSVGPGFTTAKEEAAKSAVAKENLASNFFDFEGFKAALVRLCILSGDILGGQGYEQL